MICVENVSVSPSRVAMNVGHTFSKIKTQVYPADATNPRLQWTSNNTDIVTVNSETGHMFAKGLGSTYVMASARDGSGKRDYIDVTVTDDILARGVIVCPASMTMTASESRFLSVTVEPSDAANTDVFWYSSNPSVASVNAASGLVIGCGLGTATIIAEAADYSGIIGTCEVTVAPSVEISLPCGRRYNWNQRCPDIHAIIEQSACAWTCGLDIANICNNTEYLPQSMAGDTYWSDISGYTWELPSSSVVKFNDNYITFSGSQATEKYYAKIRSEIQQNRPIVIKLKNSAGANHFVVAYGYTGAGASTDEIKVLDPARPGTENHIPEGRDTTLTEAIRLSKKGTFEGLKSIEPKA